ncbi:MAG: hypothetical protein AVDCRST_MAG96-2078 [uncultured Segetibacter sp.]|uniref:Uncharacterized protein n=1 Tax=uncultured Segetibacter sp. TaxID=481133 RepID=A0A6J4SR61_9BACT|nr:MAG: hypothetical protein AVDCRST_MAG96-2078 [uncultured Segetibacter sp.]
MKGILGLVKDKKMFNEQLPILNTQKNHLIWEHN